MSGTLPPGRKTVLLVEQDGLLEHLLRAADTVDWLHLTVTSSGDEALQRIAEVLPDLIVCRFETSDLDGRSVFLRFVENKEFKLFQRIPFIMFSGEAPRSAHASELFHRGLVGWYTLPSDMHELRDILQNVFWLHEVLEKNVSLRQEVKRSEIRYRDLLENANDFIFTLDEQGRFVYLNNRFKPLTGSEKDEWIGRPLLDLITPHDRKTAREHYDMAHQGRARVFEARILNRTQEPPILSFSITPIVDRGTIVGAMGIARDVAEQKRMEKEILDLKNFNESIIEGMEAGLLTLDLEGRITSLNAGGQNILGWTAEEAVGKPLAAVMRPGEARVLLSGDNGNPLSRREAEFTLKSGKKASIGFTVTDRVDNQRRKVGTIVSFRDISLIKQMQAEVIRMERLASLGVLASGIAHEIKNPLAGIKTLAQACDEEFDTEDPRREYLSRIIRQVNRLDDMLRTFFAYAKPKPPDRAFHHLREIVKEVGQLVAKRMETSDIIFTVEFEDELPRVWIDGPQIQQVFLNLILNAIDAMPDGGRLTVTASIAVLPRESEYAEKTGKPPFVEVRVSDTGCGIPADKLEAVFDPFFTTKPNGLGLGLSIVCRIIEEHGGDIRVNSVHGRGTEFHITLPTGEEG